MEKWQPALGFKIGGEDIPLLSFQLSESLDELSGFWEAKTDWEQRKLLKKAGQDVELSIFGKKRWSVLDGVSLQSPEDVVLKGRDKTSLLVDSVVKKFSFPKGQTFLSIAKKIVDPFGISISDPKGLGKTSFKENLATEKTSTCGDFLIDTAKKAGLFLGSEDGKSLVLRGFEGMDPVINVNKNSELIGLSLSRNMSKAYGECEFEKKNKKKQSICGKFFDDWGHPKKRCFVRGSEREARLEMEAMKKKSLSLDMSFPDLMVISLGQKVSVKLDVMEFSGFIQSLQWSWCVDRKETRVSVLWSGKDGSYG